MDVITIGDAMIAMCPEKRGPIMFTNTFEKKIGGAELNVAIGCSRLGIKAGWIGNVGDDDFGEVILRSLRADNVDDSQVRIVEGYQTSIYFREVLSDGSSRSFYYRQNSPASTMKLEDLNEEYFKKAKILHITGVFPSILPNNKKLVLEAIRLAKQNGLLISLDPNIRLKLWTKEEARDFIINILNDVDILLVGDEEVEVLLQTTNLEKALKEFFSYGISKIVIKRGDKGAIGFDGKDIFCIDAIRPKALIDTVGAGDGFAAGFLTSIIKGESFEESIRFANAVGSLVVGVEGDNEGLPFYQEVLAHLGKVKMVER